MLGVGGNVWFVVLIVVGFVVVFDCVLLFAGLVGLDWCFCGLVLM